MRAIVAKLPTSAFLRSGACALLPYRAYPTSQPQPNMNRPPIRLRAFWLSSTLSLAATLPLGAQTVSAPSPTPAGDQEETLVLNPFIVEAERDVGYMAKDTLAGTRIRTELRDTASAISVVTSQFLQDTGSNNSQSLLVYTTNTEIGGVQGNFSGIGGASTYNESANLLRPSNNTRVRGLDSADNTRDYFLTDIPWDGYIVDRVDLQRGPNSILFGVGSPSGIINTSLNTAGFKTANKIENVVGKFGSIRTSVDLNHVLIKNELAIRVAGLDDSTKYRQKPAFNHDRRIYGAVRYEPKWFGDNARTSIRANYENGRVHANRPRALPPIDAITPWFMTGSANGIANMNKLTLNPLTTWNQYGNNPAYPNSTYPWFREAFMGRLMSSNIAYYHDANSDQPLSVQMPNRGTSNGRDANGNIDGTISGFEFSRNWGIATYNNYARTALPGGQYYSNVSLSDPSIFDFYNNLMDGRNKGEWQNWKAANIAASQTFLNDRIGVELVYDTQAYQDGQTQFLGGDQYQISIDINSHRTDGSVNPNVGRAYVGNSGQYGNQKNFIDRESARFTAFGEFRAKDFMKEGWLTKFIGRHVITGVLSRDQKETDFREYARWASAPEYTAATGGSPDMTNGARQIDWIAYLGPSLAGASSAAGANLSRVNTIINPSGSTSVRYYDSTWKATNVAFDAPYTYITHDENGNEVINTGTQADNPANYVGWRTASFNVLNADNGDINSLYTSANKGRNVISSRGLTWQGYLMDGMVVPVFGWRRDEVRDARTQGPKDPTYNFSRTDFDVDTADANTRRASGESKSWGAVVHTPQSWRNKLPGNTHFSVFFNKSQNFKADAPRGDIFGNAIDNPRGRTTDYGVVMSTLDDRLTVKATWYETKVKNASLNADSAGFSNNLYYVWALPYWGATHALAALDGISSPQLRQGDWGWPWNGIATLPDGSPDNARIGAIVRDFFTKFPLSQQFVDEYGLGMNVAAMRSGTTPAQWYAAVPTYGVDGKGAGDGLGLQPLYGGRLGSFGASPTASVDTTSKGMEIEATASLTKQWNLTFNISKTKATRDAISPTIETWITDYTAFLAGDAGLIRIWGGDTARDMWKANILAPYAVLKAQLGSSAPEVAPWRFNVISNYNFDQGFLRGVNAGIAYRWEDKRILGYQYDATTDVLDISKPWHGPTDDHFDLWVGYQRKLNKHVDWRIQLNLRNVGESVHLSPVNIQPDGRVALSRIQEGMTWQISNTFRF
jgi:hypothetical protein